MALTATAAVEEELPTGEQPAVETPPRPRRGLRWYYPYAVAAALYAGLAVWIWWGVWSNHPSSRATCGCGDPALFMWFLEWAAYAVRHGLNPFHSTAMFHPGGVNLLSNTSVLAVGVVLAPVTWVFGPVTALNVALTAAPALSALSAFWLIRRWVRWAPAAFVGGLLFGFSPYALADLSVGHLMTASLFMVPLWVGALDELLLRQRRSPWWTGAWLGVVGAVQFFISTEIMVIVAMTTVLGVVVLVLFGLVADRPGLWHNARRALPGLAVMLAVLVALLAYPVWYALAGPSHLTGLVWPDVRYFGGFLVKSYFSAPSARFKLVQLGGYLGHPLPSPAYVGWSLLGVLVAGLLVFWRDRRLWFFAVMIFLTAALSLGRGKHYRHAAWVPWDLFLHVAVVENVIEERFVLLTFLGIGCMLAVLLDRIRTPHPRTPSGRTRGLAARLHLGRDRPRAVLSRRGRWVLHGARWLAAAAVCFVALRPLAFALEPYLPYETTSVTPPAWFTHAGEHLPPGQVLLIYPAPFSGLQPSLAWQAIDRLGYAQAGGGGPQGIPQRAGSVRPGFDVLARLGFGLSKPPEGTPAQLAAVRAALAKWGVTMVVVPQQPGSSPLYRGDDPPYFAAFMTAALGRKPVLQDDAWVWHRADHPDPALRLPKAALTDCDLTFHARHRPPLPLQWVTGCVYQLATTGTFPAT